MNPKLAVTIDSDLRTPARALLAFAILTSAAFNFEVNAEEEPLAVVLHHPEEASLARRIAAEINALGFKVELVAHREQVSPAAIDQVARDAEADAAVWASTAGGLVEVWASDPQTGQVIQRSLELQSYEGDLSSEVALSAVELFRASLLEARTLPTEEGDIEDNPSVKPPAEQPLDVSSEQESEPSEPHHRLIVELGPAVTGITFAAPPTVNISLAVHLRLVGMLGAEVIGVAPVVRSVIDEDMGRAEIHYGMVGGGARLSFGTLSSKWHPCVALGFAAVFFRMTAEGKGQYVGGEELVINPAPYGKLGIARTVNEHVRIRADLLVGSTLTQTVVRMGGREVATLGTPLLVGMLGLDLTLF